MSAGRSPAASVAATIAAAMALAASCRTVPRTAPVMPGQGPAQATEQAAGQASGASAVPVIRVGILTDAPRAVVSAPRGLIIREADGRERRVPRATFVALQTSAARSRFRVQIASVTDEASARTIAERARRAGVEPAVRYNPDTRTHQLRVGDFAIRAQAEGLAARLATVGLAGGWVVEEALDPVPGRVRLLETTDDLTRATILAADAADVLAVDGRTYRGSLEIRAGDLGLTVINAIDVESYLRGVVPNELSPTSFPALEGLKAQAVAARTYVLRNRGGFAARGYDICATPACQMYGGHSTEHPLSDQAVEQTRGIVAYHRGSLINALYTSTCGGHTENGANIFEGEPTPYLIGVTCAAEREAWGEIKTIARPQSLGDEAGLNRDVALLVALGVVEPRVYSAAAVRGMATEDELRAWSGKLAGVLGRQPCHPGPAGVVTRRAGFFRHLVGALCWTERAKLLAPGDEDYLLRIEDRAELLDEAERQAAAVLLQEGILTLFPDNTLRPDAPVTRVHALTTLARAALEAGPSSLVSAEFKEAAPGKLVVTEGGAEREYGVDPAARLFRALNGNRLAASELSLAAGDQIRFVAEQGRVVYLEADQSLLGAAADRSSKVYKWEVRMTPAELASAVSRYGDVGPAVHDVSPRRFGVSGRVTELAVQGSAGDLLLRGLRVRWGLGLRENLFVVDRERDASGTVKQFIFTGKGWGHGVGLCQVGSFGMAQAGSTYDRILRHYYTGITLQHAY
jgi:stage II sporulation protein D